MPVNPTYPGVYVEELPSSTHTVSGVSTSKTAFADFFAQGPVGQAVQLTSFRDFERIYGGLHPKSEASYGLLQYFNNGGQAAWVVRVVDPNTAVTAATTIEVVTPSLADTAQEARDAATKAAEAAKNATDAASQIDEANAGLQANIAATQTHAAADATRTVAQALSYVATLTTGDAKTAATNSATAATTAATAADSAADSTQKALATAETAATSQALDAATKAAVAAAAEASTAAKAASDAAASAATAVKTAADAATSAANTNATNAKTALDTAKTASTTAAAGTDDAAKKKAAADLAKADAASTTAANQAKQVQDSTAAAVDAANKAAAAAKTASDAAKTASDAAATAAATPAPAAATTSAESEAAGKALADEMNTLVEETNATAAATLEASKAAAASSIALEIEVEQAGASSGPIGTQAKEASLAAAAAAQDAAAKADAAAAAAEAAKSVDVTNAAAAADARKAILKAAAEAATAAAVAADKASDASVAAQAVADAAEAVSLVISAANPGSWGNSLQVSINPAAVSGMFDLNVQRVQTVSGKRRVISSEIYTQLTLDETSPRYAPGVVNDASVMIQLDYRGPKAPGAYPDSTALSPDAPVFVSLVGGVNGNVAGASALIAQMQGALDYIAPDIFNILCLPGVANYSSGEANSAIAQAIPYCAAKRAMYIIDIPANITTTSDVTKYTATFRDADNYSGAVYFPRLVMPDPLQEYRPRNVAASGTVAGIYARTDTARGVWKAPAGIEAAIQGAVLAVQLTDQDSGTLNPLGINALRSFPVYGSVVWGARTLAGADQLGSQWKYINVRRLADYIEESLFQNLKWVVFEPNYEPTWAQIRLEVNSFLAGLFAGGAFQGATPDQAFFCHCDSTTTTQTDVDNGIVNIIVGFAPTKPAEFVILQIEQIAGQTV